MLFSLGFAAPSFPDTPQTSLIFCSCSVGSSLCLLCYIRPIFTLLSLLSFPHLPTDQPLHFWAKLCRCFSQQLHLPNQFVPMLLVVSSLHLPVTHARTTVYGATCDVTCWSRSMNSSLLEVYVEKDKKTLPVAICFTTPQAAAWELRGGGDGRGMSAGSAWKPQA